MNRHNKIIQIIFLFFIMSSGLARGMAEYSEASDVFELMDHVSLWHKDLPRTYYNEWTRRFTLSLEDKNYLEQYKKMRLKYHKNIGEGEDIFGKMPIGYDVFSRHFYENKTVDSALKALSKKGMAKSDLVFLTRFYKHFKESIMTFSKESVQFKVLMFSFNKKWKGQKIERHLRKMVKFILGKKGRKVKLKIRPVWYPSNEPVRIDMRGPFLIMRMNPISMQGQWDMDSIGKKALSALIHGQPKVQRGNLTKLFHKKCRGREDEFQAAINIVFGTMLPQFQRDKKNFDLYQKWSHKTFVNVYSMLLFPLAGEELKGRGEFSGRFMTEAAKLCRQVHNLALQP